jgi:hypothetical protein
MTNEKDDDPDPLAATTITRPIVIDLGKQRRKAIAGLKRGEGELVDEVTEAVREVVGELDEEAQGKVVVPVVVVYRKRRRRKRNDLSRFWP